NGTGRMAPKPAHVAHLLSFAVNVGRPLAEVVAERQPDWADWLPQLAATADAYAARKRAANCMDYDDLLVQWARLIREFPVQRERLGRMFAHILVDDMQDTNKLQIEVVEA